MSQDPSSYCFRSAGEVRVSQYALALAVDFESRTLRGHCDYVCVPLDGEPGTRLVLDTSEITVHGVSIIQDGKEVDVAHALGEVEYATLGRPLRVDLPEFQGEILVRVKYTTAPTASALQWMTPVQTLSGLHPFLFSQCQAIHARSMLPCQDTPSTKATYKATIAAPKPLVCVMSAVSEGAADLPGPPFAGAAGQWTEFRWFQKVPIPSYLIAIAVGELQSRDISPRCRVWAEPGVVDACAWEFAETETYLKAAEDICGEYRWGRYDLLVLPPSFPYGGMENPCLTFVTPTLLAGDRSLTLVIAHEIAHSWVGNLVTNRTWECFWMNEGFTVFVERKIVKRVFGEKENGLQYESGWSALQECIKNFGPTHDFTALTPHLADGADPDDAFSTVPYEKGCAFVCVLEHLAGGEAAFAPFLKEYFSALAYGHTDPETLQLMYAEKFPEAAYEVCWQYWLTTPGLPKEKPTYDRSQVEAAKALGDRIAAGSPILAADVDGWTCGAHLVLLEYLLEKAEADPLSIERLDAIGTEYKYDGTKNAEIRYRFNMLGMKSRREKNIVDAIDFVGSQGRMKFTRPIFRALKVVDFRRAEAAFRANQSKWHPICAKMVGRDMDLA